MVGLVNCSPNPLSTCDIAVARKSLRFVECTGAEQVVRQLLRPGNLEIIRLDGALTLARRRSGSLGLEPSTVPS